MTTALIFDFDGTVLDTETPIYRAWADLYARHDVELDLVMWQGIIGTDQEPDHWANLEALVGEVDPAFKDWRRARRDELLHAEMPRPGVLQWLDDAAVLDIPVGIASSSPIEWVERHLDRLGLSDRFACFACCNEVIPAKPDPTSYRLACEALLAAPSRSVAVEDSPHGVAAAKDAGLYVVATPHPLTALLDFTRADMIVDTLEQVRLADIVVELRSARAGEREWLFTLHEAAMRERVERVYGPWVDAFQREHFDQRDPRNVIEVIVVDGERVGAVHTRKGDDGSLYVDLLEVLPDRQGAGVGGAVIGRVIGRAGDADVTLAVHKDNAARRLYERLGFTIEAETETHHRMRRASS